MVFVTSFVTYQCVYLWSMLVGHTFTQDIFAVFDVTLNCHCCCTKCNQFAILLLHSCMLYCVSAFCSPLSCRGSLKKPPMVSSFIALTHTILPMVSCFPLLFLPLWPLKSPPTHNVSMSGISLRVQPAPRSPSVWQGAARCPVSRLRHNEALQVFLTFLTFRDHLHFFVDQSLPSSSSTVCFQSCQLSVRILSYLLGCCLSIAI